MLSTPHPFATARPDIAAPFDACHRRRNKLPSSHPYDEKTLSRTKSLAKREQSKLVDSLKTAYRAAVRLCVANSIFN
jgi:hypothetical protein